MQWERPAKIYAREALTAQGWQRDVLLHIDKTGHIARMEMGNGAPAALQTFDVLLPGMANVHSHAFQRAMAGLTEIAATDGQDNFWTWREVMYDFALRLSPEQVGIIARYLYIKLLKQGYTAVGEFHYLHHDVNGKPYTTLTELSDHIAQAVQETGIHLTHLPVLYETSNFGGAPASPHQRRFIHTPDSFIALLEALKKKYEESESFSLGIAPHSLRAVKTESLKTVLEALPKLGMKGCPIHIHAAEQEKEVKDCLSWSGQRPVEWLLDNMPVDTRWCFIHATHMTGEETRRLAESGAVAGLCPTTEANLGDGIFPAESFLRGGGRFGIGSDSNICVSPWAELRQLEYAQRLLLKKRAVLYTSTTPSIGRTLYESASAGGAHALGIQSGVIQQGARADLIAISKEDHLLTGKGGDTLLDTLIFGLDPRITDVFVQGRHIIRNGQHPLDEPAGSACAQTLRSLQD